MIHIKKLNEVGDHFILIVIFILLFGILGTFWLIEENAASAQPELRSGMSNSGGPYCLDDNADGGNGTKVDAWPCNGTAAQKYSFSGGEIHIGDGCAVEQGASANSGVGGGAKWAGNVVIGSCSNPAPWGGVWTESGGTFHNTHAQSKGGQYCLDVEGFASKGPIDIYACNGGANQSWTASTYTSSGGGSSNGGGGEGQTAAEICKEVGLTTSAECDAVGDAVTIVQQNYPKWNTSQTAKMDNGDNWTQLQCLGELWFAESTWNYQATNPAGGNPAISAYGIPQADPGDKMSSSGSDWESNPVTQIKWGLSYISSVWGTPCNAENSELSIHSYIITAKEQ